MYKMATSDNSVDTNEEKSNDDQILLISESSSCSPSSLCTVHYHRPVCRSAPSSPVESTGAHVNADVSEGFSSLSLNLREDPASGCGKVSQISSHSQQRATDSDDAVPAVPTTTSNLVSPSRCSSEVPIVGQRHDRKEVNVSASPVRQPVEPVRQPVEEHYDIIILHAEADRDNAEKLQQIVSRFVTLSDGRKPCFFPEDFGNIFVNLTRGLELSSYKFIFLDTWFSTDEWAHFQQNGALAAMINRRDQSIVPIKANRDINIPTLLQMFRALDVQRLLRGRRLDDISDVEQMTVNDFDATLLNSIARMIDPNATVKARLPALPPKSESRAYSILRKYYSELVERLDPDNGLLGTLLSLEVITFREMESIRAERTYFDRNESLLKLLLRKDDDCFNKFIASLIKVGQIHIAGIMEPRFAVRTGNTS